MRFFFFFFFLRCENFYGGTLSLQVADTARGNLVKLLMGVTAMTPEIRQALDAMGNMWSASTWQARARLWERLTAFCHWKQIEITPIHAVTFIASLPIKIQGKLSYARSLASLLNLAGKGTNPLRFYIKSLMAEGATEPSNGATNAGVTETIVEPPSSQRKTYVAALLLEGGKPVVRDSDAHTRQIPRSVFDKNRDMVGQTDQSIAVQPVSSVNVYGCGRAGHGSSSGLHNKAGAVAADVKNIGIRSGCEDTPNSGDRFRLTLSETRSYNTAVCGSSEEQYAPRGSTTISKASVPRFASSIQRRPGYHRVGVGHAESNQQVTDHVEASKIFRKFLDDIPQEKVRHTITRTRRTSKVALPKDYSIPLHIKQGIPRMSVKKLREMMNEATGDRFDETLETLLRLPEQASTIPLYKSFLPHNDIKELAAAGFISRVSDEEAKVRPSLDWVIPFTVVEPGEHEHSERRRFIAWTQADNDRIKEIYEPYVPVRHAAYYLHRAKEESAVKRDLACGFWQVAIPEESRQKFRFKDAKGDLYELTVMPMGHRCAPELMHTLTATLAGDRNYCTEKHAFFYSGLDVYIDGIRFAARDEIANKYARFVDDRADRLNALFKDRGEPPAQIYTFNGIKYFHRQGKVALGDKISRRLRQDDFAAATYASLESGVGRLIFASAVMGVHLPHYHLEMKIVRRRINNLNRDPTLLDKPVSLPTPVRIALSEWRDKLLYKTPVDPPPHPDTVPHNYKFLYLVGFFF